MYYICMCIYTYAVRYRYNGVHFVFNPHNRHPKVRPCVPDPVMCRYNAVWFITILHNTLRKQWQIVNQILGSLQSSQIAPSRATCGVSIGAILEKIERVIMAPHCMWVFLWVEIWVFFYFSHCSVIIITERHLTVYISWWRQQMEAISVLLFTGHRWIPRTKASDAELWWFLWPAPE